MYPLILTILRQVPIIDKSVVSCSLKKAKNLPASKGLDIDHTMLYLKIRGECKEPVFSNIPPALLA